MPTGQQIVTQAWIDLGIGEPGQSPGPSMSFNGLNKLNQWLDSISGMREFVYEIAASSYLLTANQTFQIGPTAAAPFNVERPIRVENANIILTITGANPQRFPLKIVSQAAWMAIRDKYAVGTTPETLYVDPKVPNAELNLHPIPDCHVVTDLELGVWSAVSQIATLATNVNLPPTYYQYLILGLQLQLVPTYGNLVNPTIIQLREAQFEDAKRAVVEMNTLMQLEQLASPQAATPASGSNPQISQLLQELRATRALQQQG